uniref:Prolipoprotein diacylglyceryl transferase n=1 Tax=Paulinella chromatophora TaxID=39717 RepID=B1X5F0_PAUCH|nr:prolipoprotein diacylglyceryl transferase [Paulinella chromatophora]ACB43169.1 prolipoprotein diacylglyceryl transferase [Paulinella chromatophora]
MSVLLSVMFTSPGPLIFRLGALTFHWYGLLISFAVLLGLILSTKLARQRRINPILIIDLLPILVITAVIGARTYYVIFEWQSYQLNWTDIMAIWKGGIAIHGALIAGVVTTIIFCRWRYQSFWALSDILVPSIAMGQAIGRWGNFFNSEAFGLPTNLLWKLSIPYLNRPILLIDQTFFHPTFLYESLWDIGICLLLLMLLRRSNQNQIHLPNGAVTCLYLVTYSLGRFWIEGIRSDPLCLIGHAPFCEAGLHMAQLMSLLMIIVGVIGFCLIYTYHYNLPESKIIKI